MPCDNGDLILKLKARLNELYGSRFRELILYGSAAKGKMDDESDIDLICLIEGPINVSYEICRIIDNTSDIVSCRGEDYRAVHIIPVDEKEYKRDFPLYIEVRRDGVPV